MLFSRSVYGLFWGEIITFFFCPTPLALDPFPDRGSYAPALDQMWNTIVYGVLVLTPGVNTPALLKSAMESFNDHNESGPWFSISFYGWLLPQPSAPMTYAGES